MIVATGGWAAEANFQGAEHAISSWDVLNGSVRLTGSVLILDEIGDHSACVCADYLSGLGCHVTLATPDRSIAYNLGPTNSSVVLRDLTQQHVSFRPFSEIQKIEAEGSTKHVYLRHVLTGDIEHTVFDHVIIEQGTEAQCDLYTALKPLSSNNGQLDQTALLKGLFPFIPNNHKGGFYLARIGDAVAGRNIHAALFDALRVCKDL